MNISNLLGKPHMHIKRAFDNHTGKFFWAAEERMKAIGFVLRKNHKEQKQ